MGHPRHRRRAWAYEGRSEPRLAEDGSLEAIRLVQLQDVLRTDGRAIDLVWTATVMWETMTNATLTVALTRADFITQVGDLVV